MKAFKVGLKKKCLVILFLLLLTNPLLSLIMKPFSSRNQTRNGLFEPAMILPVSALWSRSSTRPWPFFSGSGTLHLLFIHEFGEYDITVHTYYHTYQFPNGSWAQPKILSPLNYQWIIFDIVPNDFGFTIYYFQRNESSCLVDQYHQGRSIAKMSYIEDSESWSDPIALFGEEEIIDFLSLPKQSIKCHLHSFYLMNNGSFFVVWSFSFYPSDNNLTHAHKGMYIVSFVDNAGGISSQPIQGIDIDQDIRIVETLNDSFFLYTLDYTRRAVFFPNNTVSNWYETPMVGNFSERLPETTYIDHQMIYYRKVLFLDELMFDYFLSGGNIIELSSEILKAVPFSMPYNISSLNRSIIKRDFNADTNDIFITGLFTNDTIEIWEFNSSADSWQLMSALNYVATGSYHYWEDVPIIDLLLLDNNCHIFWDQEVDEYLHEIFTVSYGFLTDEWTLVTQVTNTTEITDDYTAPSGSNPWNMILPFLITFAGLSLVGFFFHIYFIRKKV